MFHSDGRSFRQVLFLGLYPLVMIFLASSIAVAQNYPPQIVSCPRVISGNNCDTFEYDFDATDAEGDSFTFELVSGPGIINPITGQWTWKSATIAEGNYRRIEVRAVDSEAGPICLVGVSIINMAPVISCPDSAVTVLVGESKTQVVTATDDCDEISFSIVNRGGATGSVTVIDGSVSYTPSDLDSYLAQPITMTVEATDGVFPSRCNIEWNVVPEAPYAISLGAIDESLPGVISNTVTSIGGHLIQIHIGLDRVSAQAGFGGFDLRVIYDTSALTIHSASQGSIYDECGWEYFTYRVTSPSDVHIIGIADQNDGPRHPGCGSPTPYVGQLPTTLASISFLAQEASIVRGQCFPVSFYWSDCGDNILSDGVGEALLAATVTNANDTIPINDPSADLPTLLGMPDFCADQTTALRQVDYQNGQICFSDECPPGVCSNRGDLNNNGLPYEVGDVVLFTNFFLLGESVFEDHIAESTIASDVNADGVALTIADLIYLFRVVVGDATPFPVSAPLVTPTVER